MSNLKKQERAALEAVAERFHATLETGSGRVWLAVSGKRVDVEIRTLPPRGAFPVNVRPGLRFDKIANRVIERLRGACAEFVPDGTTVVLTLTAPIRLASKTTAVLEDKIRSVIGRRDRDSRVAIHGNHARIRILRGQSGQAPKMIGFVHNFDTDPVFLLNMAREMIELFGAGEGRQTVRSAGDRWLIVISNAVFAPLDAYRAICGQLRVPTRFKKVLIVFVDQRVEPLL